MAEKIDIFRKYKFALVFENHQEKDYVTEKYICALQAGTVKKKFIHLSFFFLKTEFLLDSDLLGNLEVCFFFFEKSILGSTKY